MRGSGVPSGPLIHTSDIAITGMVEQAKKRGFVTFDQLNELLPSDTTSPEQIEDVMSMLSDMGINITDSKEKAGAEPNVEPAEAPQRAIERIIAIVPAADMLGYSYTLRTMSQGRATYKVQFDHYAPVPPQDEPPFQPAVGMRA
jgi:Sigma-70 factor, region 1.1/Elongation factor G C-terminus